MDIFFEKKCPKSETSKKFWEKKNFFCRNKLKNFFSKMRAFSRKITFLTLFQKSQKNGQKKMDMGKKNPNLGFFFVIRKNQKKQYSPCYHYCKQINQQFCENPY